MGRMKDWTEHTRGRIEKARRVGFAAIDQSVEKHPYKALVINLESSRDRFERVTAQLKEAGVPFERVAGTRGRDLPNYAVRRLAPYVLNNIENIADGQKRFGTLGCFLGHIRAWEVAAAGDLDYHLILEDDAMLSGTLPRSLGALGVEPDFDLCFCNVRMEPLFIGDEPFPTRPQLFTALAARSSRPPFQAAIGGDGYFVSREGATKLIEIVDRTGTLEHVDWFLFAAGIAEEEAEQLRPDDRARKVYNRFRAHLRPARDIPLRAMALWPALIHGSGLPSTRKERAA